MGYIVYDHEDRVVIGDFADARAACAAVDKHFAGRIDHCTVYFVDRDGDGTHIRNIYEHAL